MYAYIDETGNTGPNLFDSEQPTFMYGALMTRLDFDTESGASWRSIASQVGQTYIHASELGVYRLEQIAGGIRDMLLDADAHISICRVVKLDLAVTKLADILLDSGENLAVLPHLNLDRLFAVFDHPLRVKLGWRPHP